jgi:hypothetical protein
VAARDVEARDAAGGTVAARDVEARDAGVFDADRRLLVAGVGAWGALTGLDVTSAEGAGVSFRCRGGAFPVALEVTAAEGAGVAFRCWDGAFPVAFG